MFSKLIVSVAVFSAFLGAVSAQSAAPSPAPTSTSQVSPCILNCTLTSLPGSGCTSATDLPCLCTSSVFQQAATQCLTSQCSASEVQSADALQKAECANIVSASGSGTAASNSSSSSTDTSSPTGAATTGGASSTGTAKAAGTNSNSSPASSPSPSPTSPTTSTNGSSTTPSPSTNAAGLRLVHQFTFGASHVIGLAGALAGVLTGFTILL